MKNSDDVRRLKFNFDESTLKILYYKNKDYIIPVGVILTSLLLFLFVVVAQIQDFFSIQAEVSVTKERILKLQNNLTIIEKLDEGTLDSDLRLVFTALPVEKNYSGILNAVTAASQNANVSLDDFSFEVGDLSSSSAQVSPQPLSINLTLNIQGGVLETQRLMRSLTKTMPLSQVLDIQIQNNLSNLTTNFYYKPLSPVRIDYSASIPSFSEKEKKTLEALSSF